MNDVFGVCVVEVLYRFLVHQFLATRTKIIMWCSISLLASNVRHQLLNDVL